MKKLSLIPKLVLAAALMAAALTIPAPSQASNCPRPILCTDVYQPVICSNGVVYSNDCYAYRACATGCTPYGGGGGTT